MKNTNGRHQLNVGVDAPRSENIGKLDGKNTRNGNMYQQYSDTLRFRAQHEVQSLTKLPTRPKYSNQKPWTRCEPTPASVTLTVLHTNALNWENLQMTNLMPSCKATARGLRGPFWVNNENCLRRHAWIPATNRANSFVIKLLDRTSRKTLAREIISGMCSSPTP